MFIDLVTLSVLSLWSNFCTESSGIAATKTTNTKETTSTGAFILVSQMIPTSVLATRSMIVESATLIKGEKKSIATEPSFVEASLSSKIQTVTILTDATIRNTDQDTFPRQQFVTSSMNNSALTDKLLPIGETMSMTNVLPSTISMKEIASRTSMETMSVTTEKLIQQITKSIVVKEIETSKYVTGTTHSTHLLTSPVSKLLSIEAAMANDTDRGLSYTTIKEFNNYSDSTYIKVYDVTSLLTPSTGQAINEATISSAIRTNPEMTKNEHIISLTSVPLPKSKSVN